MLVNSALGRHRDVPQLTNASTGWVRVAKKKVKRGGGVLVDTTSTVWTLDCASSTHPAFSAEKGLWCHQCGLPRCYARSEVHEIPRRWQSTSAHSSSVNPDEISHFNALASTWWDPHGSSRLLHLMNPLRHDFIRILPRQPAGRPSRPSAGYATSTWAVGVASLPRAPPACRRRPL